MKAYQTQHDWATLFAAGRGLGNHCCDGPIRSGRYAETLELIALLGNERQHAVGPAPTKAIYAHMRLP